jgi:hypothetical protein
VKNAAPRVALVLAVVIVYHKALSAAFFDDDFQWLVGSWSFTPARLVAFGSLTHFYRPVVELYFASMTPLLGGSPALFHATSIVLHAATVAVVFSLASRIFGRTAPHIPFAAALFFAVQPSDVEAITWVSAISETVGTLFGCLSLLWFLRWREEERGQLRMLSIGAFALALLTHESSVVFVVVLLLADWWICRVRTSAFRTFAPYAALTLTYLSIDVWINTRNYVVSEGHYTLGLHVVTNALDYIQALYVGRRDWINYAAIAAVVLALMVYGNARVRFATCWMLLALAPFLSFNWGNTSRYLYQPAIGFSLLLAEGVLAIDNAIARRQAGVRFGRHWTGAGSAFSRTVPVWMVIAAVAIRFAMFAASNVRDFAERSQVYPQYLARFRENYGTVPANSTVPADPPTKLPHQFVNAAVQWDYHDPTIRIVPYEEQR